MAANSKKSDLSYFSVSQIQIAQENDLLFEQFAIANADDLALIRSIQEQGIQEPLVISADGFLLSGHRRFAVCAEWSLWLSNPLEYCCFGTTERC